MRLFELICEVRAHPPELIQSVKDLWDQEKSIENISIELNIPMATVGNILNVHYKDRELRRLNFSADEIDLVKQLYDQGLSFNDISAKSGIGVQRIDDLLRLKYKNRQKRIVRNVAATSEDKDRMGKMYAAGASLTTIGKEFNITSAGAFYHLTRLPNYNEVKQDRIAAIALQKERTRLSQVNTKRQKSSEPGNDRLQSAKGRSNRGTKNKDFF